MQVQMLPRSAKLAPASVDFYKIETVRDLSIFVQTKILFVYRSKNSYDQIKKSVKRRLLNFADLCYP